MEPVTLTIAGVVLTVSAGVAWGVRKYKEVRQKNLEIAVYCAALDSCYQALRQYSDSYMFEECDKLLIRQCQDYLDQKFHGNYAMNFAQRQTMEDKKALAVEVCWGLANQMGIHLDEIRIEQLDESTNGRFRIEGGFCVIYLQEALLIADPEQLVRSMCHELRHCLQNQALGNDRWGFSPQRIGTWLYSLENYVSADAIYNYEPYVRQAVEVDANNFAEAIVPRNV